MKKIILFIAVAMAMVGCKKEEKQMEGSAVSVENAKTKETADSSGNALRCSENLIVVRSKFNSLLQYKAWVDYNKFLNIVCSNDNTSAKIDLDQYQNDPDNSQKSIWLEANASYIDMDASGPYTVDAHSYDAPNPDNYVYVTIGFGELVNKITKKKYDSDMYNNYVEIKPDILNNTIIVDTLADYSYAKACFSIPFFRSLKKKYDIKDDTLLYFTTVPAKSKMKLLFKFKTSVTNDNFIYFDMTDNPRKKNFPASPL